MNIFSPQPIELLGISLTLILIISLVLQFTGHRDAIVLLFFTSLFIMMVGWSRYFHGVEFLQQSRDVKILTLFTLFSIASLQIHTPEVMWGLGKAIVNAAYLAGYRFGHAIQGLV